MLTTQRIVDSCLSRVKQLVQAFLIFCKLGVAITVCTGFKLPHQIFNFEEELLQTETPSLGNIPIAIQ